MDSTKNAEREQSLSNKGEFFIKKLCMYIYEHFWYKISFFFGYFLQILLTYLYDNNSYERSELYTVFSAFKYVESQQQHLKIVG